ncbi:8291_t:CDS:2, partial [Racocetra persica]
KCCEKSVDNSNQEKLKSEKALCCEKSVDNSNQEKLLLVAVNICACEKSVDNSNQEKPHTFDNSNQEKLLLVADIPTKFILDKNKEQVELRGAAKNQLILQIKKSSCLLL